MFDAKHGRRPSPRAGRPCAARPAAKPPRAPPTRRRPSPYPSGEAETIFQKAILEQGRGRVLDTLAEIQERHRAVKDLEASLLELHQIFLDMAVLVEAQGEMLDNIEKQARGGRAGGRAPRLRPSCARASPPGRPERRALLSRPPRLAAPLSPLAVAGLRCALNAAFAAAPAVAAAPRFCNSPPLPAPQPRARPKTQSPPPNRPTPSPGVPQRGVCAVRHHRAAGR
jgi:hypothetical protein